MEHTVASWPAAAVSSQHNKSRGMRDGLSWIETCFLHVGHGTHWGRNGRDVPRESNLKGSLAWETNKDWNSLKRPWTRRHWWPLTPLGPTPTRHLQSPALQSSDSSSLSISFFKDLSFRNFVGTCLRAQLPRIPTSTLHWPHYFSFDLFSDELPSWPSTLMLADCSSSPRNSLKSSSIVFVAQSNICRQSVPYYRTRRASIWIDLRSFSRWCPFSPLRTFVIPS